MNCLRSDEVKRALAEGRPVIALESTIISHGMPYPKNVETALECEALAREYGAVPATCAVIGGRLCAGLSVEQIEYLGKTGLAIKKASRRDLPLLIASRGDGAATVAATMIIAALAGIRVFATGGVGGVHRGAEISMDISADLEELASTPVCVVCAGAKSILDIGLTLEYLETKGVPVIGYGTDDLPAFYCRRSGYKLPLRADTPGEVASAIIASGELGFKSGMLVANPIPEEYAMDKEYMDGVIEASVNESRARGITGKELTPFLLSAIVEATGGKSLEANIALVKNNVKLAARIASSLAEMRK